jgi:hypothetical protein
MGIGSSTCGCKLWSFNASQGDEDLFCSCCQVTLMGYRLTVYHEEEWDDRAPWCKCRMAVPVSKAKETHLSPPACRLPPCHEAGSIIVAHHLTTLCF